MDFHLRHIRSPSLRKEASFNSQDSANSKTLFGLLDYGFLLPYSIGMMLYGRLTRGLRVTHVLAFTTLLGGLLTIMFGMGYYWDIHVFLYYFGIQLFSGLFMSAGWPCLIHIITNWVGKSQFIEFLIHRRGFILGVWNSHSHIGNVLGTFIAGYYADTEWALSFVVPGIITVVFGVLIWCFMLEKPQDVGLRGIDSHTAEKTGGTTAFSDIFSIPCFFCYAFCCFFVKMNAYILLYWLPNFIYSSSNGFLTPNQAGNMSTFYDFGSILGCMLSGWLLDRFGRGPMICFIQLLVCCPLVLMLRAVSVSNYNLYSGLLFGIGMLVNGSFGLLVTAIAADLGAYYKIRDKPGVISMISSFIDGVGSLGAAFGPLLAGILATHSWNRVFSLLICSLVLSLISLVKPSIQSHRPLD